MGEVGAICRVRPCWGGWCDGESRPAPMGKSVRVASGPVGEVGVTASRVQPRWGRRCEGESCLALLGRLVRWRVASSPDGEVDVMSRPAPIASSTSLRDSYNS
jgi:hypothetical protein